MTTFLFNLPNYLFVGPNSSTTCKIWKSLAPIYGLNNITFYLMFYGLLHVSLNKLEKLGTTYLKKKKNVYTF